MKKLIFFFYIVLLFVLFIQPLNLFAQAAGYKITGNIIIDGPAKWDYLSIYKPLNQLFVSHGSETNVNNFENNSGHSARMNIERHTWNCFL